MFTVTELPAMYAVVTVPPTVVVETGIVVAFVPAVEVAIVTMFPRLPLAAMDEMDPDVDGTSPCGELDGRMSEVVLGCVTLMVVPVVVTVLTIGTLSDRCSRLGVSPEPDTRITFCVGALVMVLLIFCDVDVSVIFIGVWPIGKLTVRGVVELVVTAVILVGNWCVGLGVGAGDGDFCCSGGGNSTDDDRLRFLPRSSSGVDVGVSFCPRT